MNVKRFLGFALVFSMVFSICSVFVLSPQPVFAQTATNTISQGLQNTAGTTYDTNLTATVFIGNLIKAMIGATGIIFLVITVYAGIIYMTAMGDTEKVKKAKTMLSSSVIGILIIIGAYALTSYIVGALSQATVPTQSNSTTGGGSSAEGS